jgi:hypothetical protein
LLSVLVAASLEMLQLGNFATAQAAGSAILIDTGSTSSYTDSLGRVWSADTDFVGGNTALHGPLPISGTSDPALYRTERWGLTGYRIPVPNGQYVVILHFAEMYTAITSAGQRVFGVSVEGTSLGNLDVFALAGGADRALSVKTVASVTNGEVDISFRQVIQNPMIDAIEVLPDLSTYSATSTRLQTCAGSLQTLINAAAPGSVLKLPACIFRESVTINKPITLDGQNQTEVRGSDVWTGWSPSGAYWTSSLVLPNLGTDSAGAAYTNQFRAYNLEQVFLDGTPLTHVPSNPGISQFALDSTRHVLLGTNPAGHLVEVTTRKNWVITNANYVTLTNLAFRHAATASLEHAIGNDDHANFVVSNSTMSDAHGGMLSFGGGAMSSKAVNNRLMRAGDVAIGGYLSGGALIQGNTLTQNGYGGWDWNWQAGAIKMVSATNLTLDSNVAWGNNGPGLWCDIGCQTVTISNNKSHDNTGPGIQFEISTGARIYGNAVWNAQFGQPGIFISNSGSAEVYDNYVYNSAPGIFVYDANRPDSAPVTNNNIHNNFVIMTADGQLGLGYGDYGTGVIALPSSNNTGLNNAFWYPVPESGQQRFEYGSRTFGSIAGFRATAGGAGSTYMSDTQESQVLITAGIH